MNISPFGFEISFQGGHRVELHHKVDDPGCAVCGAECVLGERDGVARLSGDTLIS